MVMFQPQQKITRPMGNAQARNTPLGAAPAFGNTTNVNGAQTASRSISPQGRPMFVQGVDQKTGQVQSYPITHSQMAGFSNPFEDQVQSGSETPGYIAPVSLQSQQSQPVYPGGDVPGIASYYRNTAQQNYASSSAPKVGEERQAELRGLIFPQQNQQSQFQPMVSNSPLQSNAQPSKALPILDASRQAAQMRGLAGKIDAIRERSQAANPLVPNSPARTGFVNPQAESDRRMAPMMARDAANQQNTPANGMVGFANDPTRYNPTDPGIQARQQDNAQRAASGQLMSRERGNRFSGIEPLQSQTDFTQGDYARAQQVMMQKRGEREAARAADPAANEQRLAAIGRATSARANKHQEFMDANGGLNYRQADRLEKKRQSIERRALRGDITREEAQKQTQAAVDTALRRGTGMVGISQNGNGRQLPFDEVKKTTKNIPAQSAEVAAQQVQKMAEGSSVLKSIGIKADTDFETTMNSIATMNPSQMTSTQKFEAAKHLHEFLLSQMESGNPDYQVSDSAGAKVRDRRVALIGLDALNTKDRTKMVQWFDDLYNQSKGPKSERMAPIGPNNAPPMGIMPPGARIAG